MTAPAAEFDLAVVGAGILGLAVARELQSRRSGMRVVVLERHPEVATEQSGRNSGVVHAGIYYAPGSLKARLCVEGARELYAYCEEHGIPFEKRGKLVVARDESELPRLDELERRGRANEVPGLRRVDAEQLREIEPYARGVAALHSPETGVVDFAQVARAFAADVRAAGGEIELGHEATVADVRRRARFAVFCAGHAADRLAVEAGADPDPRIVPFRGAYLRLRPEKSHLVRGLIYPVPDPRLPFLGVHLSRHLDGNVSLGPGAVLAPTGLARSLAWPGTWRMARRWWRTGATETARALSSRRFAREA
ncbi:MAG TPA: L-2-hydroxyglutarate oxidase, partial [Thermoleophilaceae bacterium]|nr:L-2-hydroxyglutarate oxidase [Thermoleophilaceae bacterium]